jgi:integrase
LSAKSGPWAKANYNKYRGGYQAWIAAVEALPMSLITPEKVRIWKKAYIDKAGRDELARRRRIGSVNSYIRRAKCLFSKKIKLKSVAIASPFEDVTLERRTDTKFYGAGVDPVNLLRAALGELSGERVEELKAFLLGLTLGLRRKEIDLLEWQSFNFVTGTLQIMPTQWHALKTHESAAELPVEPEILELFKGWRARATGPFVIECNRPPQPSHPVDYDYYRCNPVFKALLQWLRQQGVQGAKPIHTLRKMFGSALCDLHGLHAASSGLRHADLATTASFYVDRRARVTPGFGQVLSGAEVLEVAPKVRTNP